MKTLIILGGLPGVGKSYCSRILKNKISNCLYFDSDLFAKKYVEKHKVDFVSLPKEQQTKQRLKHHKAKIDEIKKSFQNHDIILLDTCFDLTPSRKMFYQLAKDSNINLIIIEIKCSEQTAKQRILGKKHEKERMVGTKETRWEIYQQMKQSWAPIQTKHFLISSDNNVEEQLDIFLKDYFR